MVEAFGTLSVVKILQNGGLSDDPSKAVDHAIGDAITTRNAEQKSILRTCEW